MAFQRISMDTSKHLFTLHGIDDGEKPGLNRELRRSQVESFLAKLPTTENDGDCT
ncbi:hypothetical protein [Roseospira goensis]|uniref:Transposase n=1 Tax=Roseospira goensis TaxID=391922 RepID=A0A7W6S0S1_9PROT|nr:hypothetical protein [Roseospira goensis]MBB4286763.1 transposase [Roseospira goensis]